VESISDLELGYRSLFLSLHREHREHRHSRSKDQKKEQREVIQAKQQAN
jgi:hypothetical protein